MYIIELCRNIKKRRHDLKLSQEEVAKMLSISVRTYNFKENGKSPFTVIELMKLAEIFKCYIADFFK